MELHPEAMNPSPQANMYRIAYTKHAYKCNYSQHWTSWHETIEELAATAQEYCVTVWAKPPIGEKELSYHGEHPTGSDPTQVAAFILSKKERIDAGYKFGIEIELIDPTYGYIPLYTLEFCKPSAVQAKEDAERARRRAAGKVHICGDEFCNGGCGTLPCGCFRSCWCGASTRRRRHYDSDDDY